MKHLTLVVLVLAVLVTSVDAQDPARLLKAAMNTEMVDQNPRAAIEQYKKVVAAGDRALAAQALLRMAGCHQKLGDDAEAQRIHAQIIKDYSDQSAVVAEARAKLVQSEPGTSTSPFKTMGPDTRLSVTSILSPDGTRVIEQDPRGLIERDLATGRERIAFAVRTAPGGEPIYRVASPIWSPDGRRVAFYAQDLRLKVDFPDAPGSGTLQIVSVATGESHEVCPLPEGPPVVQILEWTARDEILYRVGQARRGNANLGGLPLGSAVAFFLVPAAGGPVRKVFEMDTENRAYVGNVTPDGLSIIVVKSEKLVQIELATGTASDLSLAIGAAYPRVSPDGKLIAFLSRQDGAWAAYVAPMNGRPASNPVRIAGVPARRNAPPALGSAQGMRWGPVGTLRFDFEDTESNLYRIDMDPASGQPVGRPERLTRDVDGAMPAVSQDGGRILFAPPISRESLRGVVFAMRADGGDVRRLVELPAARQVGGDQITGTFGWRSPDEMFFSGQGPELRVWNVTTGAMAPLPNSAPLGNSNLFSTAFRVGKRFQFLRSRNQVVYETLDQYGVAALVVRNLGDGTDRTIWDHRENFYGPFDWRVSPDEKQIAYWGLPFGLTFAPDDAPPRQATPFALNVITIDGALVQTTLRRVGGPGGTFAWSPDSRRLLYQGDPTPTGALSLRVLDIATEDSQPLLATPFANALDLPNGSLNGLSWSPDGTFIVLGVTSQMTHRLRWSGVTPDAVVKVRNR